VETAIYAPARDHSLDDDDDDDDELLRCLLRLGHYEQKYVEVGV